MLVTRTLKNYYDTGPLDEVFGEDRVERYWDETQGQGALVKGPDGNLWHKPLHGEPQIAAPDLIDDYLGPEVDPDE